MQMLVKLKYVGASVEDLIDVYCLFIRSVAEYASVVFHPSLTEKQIKQFENIQVIALKIILQDNYVSSEASREMTGLSSLFQRRDERMTRFARRCLEHPRHKLMFPLNREKGHNFRLSQKYHVNFARTSFYKNSSVIFCQERLNWLAAQGKI